MTIHDEQEHKAKHSRGAWKDLKAENEQKNMEFTPTNEKCDFCGREKPLSELMDTDTINVFGREITATGCRNINDCLNNGGGTHPVYR